MRTRTFSSLVRKTSGQSLIEFALMFPVAFLLVVNVVNFGGLLYAYLTVANAARAGASYMIMGNSSAYAPLLPTVSQIAAVVHADLGSLPRGATAPVNVCGLGLITGGTAKWVSSYNPPVWSACTMPVNPPTGSTFTDPQATEDTLGTVEVQYRYCPFISGWNFPALGVYTTLPSCATEGDTVTGGTLITRVGAMRVLN